jgi:hypothetical protein
MEILRYIPGRQVLKMGSYEIGHNGEQLALLNHQVMIPK